MIPTTKLNCWGIGVSPVIQTLLTDCFGQSVTLSVWEKESLPEPVMFERHNPLVIFVSPDVERIIQNLPPKLQKPYNSLIRACILPEHYTQADLELGISSEVTRMLPFNVSKKIIWNILHRAHQSQHMQEDLRYMSKELLLERELLERKNALLSFMVSFFSGTSQADTIPALFVQVFDALQQLVPMKSMHAAVWANSSENSPDIRLYINAEQNSVQSMQWEGILRSYVDDTFKIPHCNVRCKEILTLKSKKNVDPASTDYFPVQFGNENGVQGILLLVSDDFPSMGRDQSEAFATALNHLSTCITNHYLFEVAQNEASLDPLTGLRNRRWLASSLRNEIARSQRYNTHLSLLMIDVDHFKKVNDTHGHLGGDNVLKAIGQIIKDTIRDTDIAYRYGGEEFCVLMPETSPSKAFWAAERLRETIAGYAFTTLQKSIPITVSIGVANLNDSDAATIDALIEKADNQLYAAKQNGRNCTCYDGNALETKVI